jgi:hypothetical protein
LLSLGLGISEARRARRLDLVVLALVPALLVAAPHPAAAAEKGKPEKVEGAPDGPVFVKLSPIVLPVYSGNKVTRQAGLVLTLELVKGKSEADVEPNRRRLTDAFLTELYGVYELRGTADRIIDPATVKQTLQGASDRVLGAGVVQQVLIQQAFEGTRAR